MPQIGRIMASQMQASFRASCPPLVTAERQDSTAVRSTASAARLPGFCHLLAGGLGQVIDHLFVSFHLYKMEIIIALTFSFVSKSVKCLEQSMAYDNQNMYVGFSQY